MSDWTLPALLTFTLLFMMTLTPSAAHGSDFPQVDSLPQQKDLPDLLAFRDGSRVASPQDWTKRRAELVALIQHYEYGHLPPAGETRGVLLVSHAGRTLSVPHRQYMLINTGPNGQKTSFVLDLLLPASFKKPTTNSTTPPQAQKAPVILRGDWSWHKVPDDITKVLLDRGYALAEFNRVELSPDNGSREAGRLHQAYPDGDFAALAAWAWGFHRSVDFLVALPEIDAGKIAVTGHSRGGKAALLAGALDERIALTNANGSGCGGAGPFRTDVPKSERLADILQKFPFWFSTNLPQFIGKEDRLPFDQHALKALCAPRALLDTEGVEDLWANPIGARVTHDASKPVFKMLGAEDKIAIHYRPGPHRQDVEDWTAFLDFADHVFKGVKPARNFDQQPPPAPATPAP